MERWKIRTHLLLLTSALLMGVIAVGGVGLKGMQSAIHSLEMVYLDRVVPLRDLKKIADLYAVNIVDATHKMRNGNITNQDALSKIEQAQREIAQTWQAYQASHLNPAETRLIGQINPLMDATKAPLNDVKEMLRKNDVPGIARFATDRLYPLIDPLSDKFYELIEVQLSEAKNQFESNQSSYTWNVNISVLILLLALFTGAGYALFFSKLLSRQLGAEPKELATISSDIAHGHLAGRGLDRENSSTGVMRSVQAMRVSLREVIGKISVASEQIETATTQLTRASERGLSSAALQNEAASSMAATVEELSA